MLTTRSDNAIDVVRRLYLYLISGISLALLVGALVSLVGLALQMAGLTDEALFVDTSGARSQLALSLATIAVAGPVWGIHWWLAQRSVGDHAPRPAAERQSAIRALFLALVLAGLALYAALASADLVRYSLTAVLADVGRQAPLASIGTVLIAVAFWAYHFRVRRRDERTPLDGAAAWLPRVYLYGASFVGMVALLVGVVRLVALAGTVLAANQPAIVAGEAAFGARLAELLATIMVGAGAWAMHWRFALMATRGQDWRGPAERVSRVRHAYFVGVILVGVSAAVAELALALGDGFSLLLGSSARATPPELVREIGGSIVLGLVFAGTWWSHRSTMIGQARHVGARFGMSARRVDGYVVALVGLATAATALAWLVGLALNVALGGGRLFVPDQQLGTFLGFAAVGSIAWIAQIEFVRRWRLANEQAEARSSARRVYLLLAAAGAVLSALGALVLLLNRLLALLLGVSQRGGLAEELSTPAGVLFVALLVGGLHLFWWRRDQAVLADKQTAPGADDSTSATVAPPVRRHLVLTTPAGADAAEALAGLRAALPEGYLLEEGG